MQGKDCISFLYLVITLIKVQTHFFCGWYIISIPPATSSKCFLSFVHLWDSLTSSSRGQYPPACTHPSLCPLGWRPRIHCDLCGWACWWSGYVDVTARSGGSCPRCCCTPKGWHRRPSRRWTSRSPSLHPPPLGTGAGKIDSWAPASLKEENKMRRQTFEAGGVVTNPPEMGHVSFKHLYQFAHLEKYSSACRNISMMGSVFLNGAF